MLVSLIPSPVDSDPHSVPPPSQIIIEAAVANRDIVVIVPDRPHPSLFLLEKYSFKQSRSGSPPPTYIF